MKSWVSSPLAINYLLSLYKNGPLYQKKYLQILKDLKIKEGYLNKNKLFLLPSFNPDNQYDTSDICIEKVEFRKSKTSSQCILKWINQYDTFNQVDIEKHVLPSTKTLLCNISIFKGVWQCNQPSPTMKVHNSFSYTEDIKYEARLIELPMQDIDFRLVIIVPNEVSCISGLFHKLVDEGLAAAVSCVQPLFTFSTVLEAPSIEFSSESVIELTKEINFDINCTQIGNVQINENGTNISVLTMLTTHKNSMELADEEQLQTESFYFALLYKDTAVFAGRCVKRLK